VSNYPVGVFASIDAGFGVKLDVVRELGIKTIQLHTPAKASRTAGNAERFSKQLKEYGIAVTVVFLGFDGETYETIARTAETVGFVPKATRQERLQEAYEIADFAKQLGVAAIGSHIGFVPHDKNSTDYQDVVAAVQTLCGHLAGNGQALHLETGQEDVDSLIQFMDDVKRNNLFVNFDPANLILYGIGNHLEAVTKLGSRIRSVHCKDALATTGKPGVDWGKEVPFGSGQVDAEAFLRTLFATGYQGPLTIEREIPAEPVRQKEEIGQAVKIIEDIKKKLRVASSK
jgi:sugar phosphate isomerase/epimerase